MQYQLFDKLRSEEFNALEADILKRGIQVPIEVDKAGKILDGHHRMEIAEKHGLEYEEIVRDFKTDEEKIEHVIMLNLARRHLDPWQWGQAFKELLKVKGVERGEGGDRRSPEKASGDTIQGLAASLGVDDRTARNRMAAADAFDKLPKMEQEAVRNKEKSIAKAEKDIAKRKKSVEDKKAAETAKAAIKRKKDNGVYHGDAFELADSIPDESCALIFTDPPYDKESLPLFTELASLAERILVDGGSMITYGGQYAIPEITDRVCGGALRWLWMLCCKHTGDVAQMRYFGIKVKWKPLLWFVKGDTRRDCEIWVEDLVESTQEKDSHPWQQSLVEANYYIGTLTATGELVVDPFCGGGTTAVAAKALGRLWWTADIDATAVDTARKRLNDPNI